jgi:class 3 adenylate cyclase/tetratricopeptide (TPR) repeat protein
MKCPKCQTENPDTQKFCGQCGAKLEKICPNCGEGNPPEYGFCGECGHNLTETAETEKKPPAVDSERKHITVLFSDLSGYTAMTERLDPEDVKDIMSQIFGDIAQVVAKYEGFIERFIGDAVMALFGVPKVHEDDAVRAIKAAREIHALVETASPGLEKKVGQPLSMHSGINTGLVVTGEVNLEKGTHGITGDAINLASRLEGLAESGEILVGHETYRQAEGYFIFERLGPKKVKGKEKLVKAYRVIAPSTRRTRFDVSAERGLTHFVGRERELEFLLDGFERAKTGQGQAFSIMAEAGVGKSRLLYEFRKAISKDDVTFLEGKCLSYSRGVAYHPVIDILKATFDIGDGDGDSEVREKVKRQLKVLEVDEASTLPYLLELLSVKDSGIDKISMSPEGRKDRIMEALKRIVLKGSEVRPLIMAIEDLHWLDKSSEDVSKYLLESISGAKVFLIFTYRPEFVQTWGGKSFHSQVNLNRLSNRESLAMSRHLLGTEDIDGKVEQFILEKAEGVPFFVEEFIKYLKDLKIIEKKGNKYQMAKDIQDVTIPSTIQDVIMAKVDSLPEGAKDVLQTGSAIEREFGYELIKRVTGYSERELLSHLSALRDSELVYERGIFPKSTNIFKHALTRDVVYDSILTKRKKELHHEIGQAVEELYKDNINEHYEVLADHYIASENYEKAAAYSKLAGKKAEKAASLNDAIAYAKKRVASIEKLPKTDDVDKQLIDARTILGLYIAQMNHFAEAKEAVDPIFNLALESDYKRRLSQIYTIVGAYSTFVEEDFLEASKHLEKALEISEEVNDIISFVLANYWLGTALSLNCEFEKAYFHINKALEINVAVNNLWGIAGMKSSIGFIYCWHGKINLAYQASSEALQIAKESGDIYSKSISYNAHGVSCYCKGFFKEAVRHLVRGADLCERINNLFWGSISRYILGYAYFDMGEYQESRNYYNEAVSILDQANLLPSFSNLCKIGSGSARAKIINNEKDINLESVCDYREKNKIKLYDGYIERYIGEILLNIDDEHVSEAEGWIKKAIEADGRNDTRWHLGRDYALYAELFKRRGDQQKAREKLSKAIEIFKECGADGWVEKYEKELAALS